MCQNLGLNRNCDSWNLSKAEKEERKRVFYCCFVVDRLSCAMHGRAPMIDERDYDTPYPSEVDDDDKTNSPTIIENFHQLIKLCEILGDILCQLYMVKGRKHIAGLATPDPVISKLDKSLNKWMAKLPPNVQYKPPNARIASEKTPAPTLQLCQVHMLFYTSLILLHRPFIPGPTQKHTPSVFPSASICTFAANKILDIVECLLAEGRLKMVNNYALYFMFTAGIIFINDALSSDAMFAFEAKININKIIRAMDEVETTWITSARHCNILGELAGLRDINLENVDEGYQRTKTEKQPEALSIAVPNSPVLVPSPLEFRNPIDAQRGVEQRFPEYITQLGRSDSVFTANSTSTTNSNRNINVVESPVQYNTQSYTATPPINTYTSDATLNRPFDPIGSAFWDVPASFDIDEWNKYLSNQSSSSENQSIPVSSMIQGSQQSYAPMMDQNNNQRQMW
jgi:hypothetical protein